MLPCGLGHDVIAIVDNQDISSYYESTNDDDKLA